MRSILPGRPQCSRQALSTVSWDGLRLVAYISGTNVIVFNGRKELVQTISLDDAQPLTALTIDEISGQIAVADKKNFYTYKPVGRDYGDLRWTRSHSLSQGDAEITYLSWASSSELLVSGASLCLWSFADETATKTIWTAPASSPMMLAKCSPDGGLVASCGRFDRWVKIWRRLSYEQDSTRFDTSYLPHPATVINLTWRKSWHQEQNLDNLLYTFCSDNQIRVWTQSEHQAYTMLHKIITIDANISIQPRRLSVGSVTKSRFAFVLDSRDLARATERALQLAGNGTDHALEHLVEIANRSPEVCLVLDGRGHMSAWSIENAGLKNKLSPGKSNLALVDGVEISLPHSPGPDDFVEIVAFANNDAAASLCILVQQYSGQIDWYQGSFVDFFDTAAPHQRVQLTSCWSGHDTIVERLIARQDHKAFISMTGQNDVIFWSISELQALIRVSEWCADQDILDAAILPDARFVILLHEERLDFWDANGPSARLKKSIPLGDVQAVGLSIRPQPTSREGVFEMLLLCENDHLISISIDIPELRSSGDANSYKEDLSRQKRMKLIGQKQNSCIEFGASTNNGYSALCSWSGDGSVQIYEARNQSSDMEVSPDLSVQLNTQISTTTALSSSGLLAVSHADEKTLSIWNIHQKAYEFHHTFEELHEVAGLYWYMPTPGLHLLAVQFTYHVAIVAQNLYATHEEVSWSVVQVIATREISSHVIEGICWAAPCSLIVAVGAQIAAFEVRIRGDSIASDRGKHGKVTGDCTMPLQLRNSVWPIFCASSLSVWAKTGQFEALQLVLRELNNELKFLVTGEIVTIETSLVRGLLKYPCSQVPASLHADFVTDFQTLQAQVHGGIAKISASQLSTKQKVQLRQVLKYTSVLLQNVKSLDNFALAYLYHFLDAVHKSEGTIFELPPISLDAVVLASQSQTQEALLHFILSYLEERNIKFVWPVVRSLGLFLFVSDHELLKTYLESVARAEYNRDPDERNPVSSSLYYLALDKKSILLSLWRRTVGVKEKEATMRLLSRDFKEAKWKETALKNAYALLSRRRFEYAAAFFLLGRKLQDAVNVCINQLHDLHLAVAIARVWDDATQRDAVLTNLMQTSLLSQAVDSVEARWLVLWADLQQENLQGAVRDVTRQMDSILETQIGARLESQVESSHNAPFACQRYQVNDPTSLLLLYRHVRQQLERKGKWTKDILSPREEWDFVLRCAAWYVRAGLDWHALHVTSTWQFVPWQVPERVSVKNVQTRPQSAAADTTSNKSLLDEWSLPDRFQNGAGKSELDKPKEKKAPTQFTEPSADSLLDSFGF